MPINRGTRYPPTGVKNFSPLDLRPIAYYQFNSGITVTGSGVSQWDDQSGNGNHLLQGTDAARPALQSDGSMLFDGIDDFMSVSFTLVQPTTVYILCNPVTSTNADRFFDGATGNSGGLFDLGDGTVAMVAGTQVNSNSGLVAGSYSVFYVVFNGASSVVGISGNIPITGNAGAGDMGGITLGAFGGGAATWGNIQVKEMVAFNVAHDASTRNQMIGYLARLGGISI